MSNPKDRLTRFLEHLDRVFEAEPLFFPFERPADGTPPVVCMVYRDMPESGFVTGVTYGVSEVSHEHWRFGRPELTISVRSGDLSWPLAVGELANKLRGKCPFCYGDVINFGAEISGESPMSAFTVFAPSFLEKGDYLGIDVGGPLPVSLAGVYPLYDSERVVVAERGLQYLWQHPNFDLYNVRRAPVVP